MSDWAEWLLGGIDDAPTPINPAKLEAVVLEQFVAPFASSRGLIAGFLRANPSLLHKQPPNGSPEAGRAWPSPRTWELASRAWAGAQVHNLDRSDAEEMLAAFVGLGPAAELMQYERHTDLPNPEDVVDGKIKFTHDPKRLNRTAAVLASCAAIVAPDKAPRRKERAAVLWTIIAEVSKDAADICVQAATVLARKGFVTGKEAHASLSKLQPILQASGYMARKD